MRCVVVVLPSVPVTPIMPSLPRGVAVEACRCLGEGDARVRHGDERHVFVDVTLPRALS